MQGEDGDKDNHAEMTIQSNFYQQRKQKQTCPANLASLPYQFRQKQLRFWHQWTNNQSIEETCPYSGRGSCLLHQRPHSLSPSRGEGCTLAAKGYLTCWRNSAKKKKKKKKKLSI
ncbi:hypothetical protein FALCPG4_001096 [Fusarium falciforme]